MIVYEFLKICKIEISATSSRHNSVAASPLADITY